MKPNKICKGSFIMAMALAAVFAIAAAWPCASAALGPKECGLIGTWYGNAGDDMYWLGVHTAGSTSYKGELLMDWVGVSDSLLGGAARLTGGRGVWEKLTKDKYKYTWYAYGIDEAGLPLYAVRVIGLAANANCDRIDIGYTYEIFELTGWPQDFSGTPLYKTTGSAAEKRVPLTTTP